MFLENTPSKLPLDFHGVNFMEFYQVTQLPLIHKNMGLKPRII